MTLSFVEAMRGWLQGAGSELPVSFELRAIHRSGRRFDVQGVLAAPPLAQETMTRGTLDLGPGELTYHLTFDARDGRRLTLDAVKHPSLRAPHRSMTRMHTEIRDAEGAVLASGEMRFATRDLPRFLSSWVPQLFGSKAHRELDTRRRQIERRLLSDGAL
jgi:hypothetical protein